MTRATRRLDVISALNRAIERRDEGVVIKQCASVYTCAQRLKVAGWLKLKPDYVAALQDDLDLLVVGGYYGEHSRARIISHFMLAVRDDSEAAAGASARFVAFCKVRPILLYSYCTSTVHVQNYREYSSLFVMWNNNRSIEHSIYTCTVFTNLFAK